MTRLPESLKPGRGTEGIEGKVGIVGSVGMKGNGGMVRMLGNGKIGVKLVKGLEGGIGA